MQSPGAIAKGDRGVAIDEHARGGDLRVASEHVVDERDSAIEGACDRTKGGHDMCEEGVKGCAGLVCCASVSDCIEIVSIVPH
ncbi:hypothetical protein E2542_SST12890 [Spatholobus suberectus]|nr:hypothetical protein E2542_SST12890 [Spatholobus suberectus]